MTPPWVPTACWFATCHQAPRWHVANQQAVGSHGGVIAHRHITGDYRPWANPHAIPKSWSRGLGIAEVQGAQAFAQGDPVKDIAVAADSNRANDDMPAMRDLQARAD